MHGRAILEMEQFIRESYPDAVKTCNICHGLLIQVLQAAVGAGPQAQPAGPPLLLPQDTAPSGQAMMCSPTDAPLVLSLTIQLHPKGAVGWRLISYVSVAL